jgi:hypothetical protein
MRNAGMLAAGLMSVWMLVGCGGTIEESSESGVTGDTQALARIPPNGPVTYPYCWNFNGTSCTSLNAKATCTDGIYFDYVCTCGSDWKFHCPEVR